MNRPEWIKKFSENQTDLRAIVAQFHPGRTMMETGTIAGKAVVISAASAEAACAVVRAEIAKKTKIDPLVQFDAAVPTGDVKTLCSLLNAAWFGMPESMASRKVPGFGPLCDLCEGCDDVEFDEDE